MVKTLASRFKVKKTLYLRYVRLVIPRIEKGLCRLLVGLGNGILTSSVYIVEVVSPDNRGSVVMVSIKS